jgi:tetratricopeptide (TPR) repeat protein
MKKGILLLFAVSAILFLASCGKKPEELYKTAQNLFDQKNYLESLDNLNKAILKNPKYGEAYFLRAKVKAITGDFKGGLQDLDSTVKYNPNSYVALYMRGLARAKQKDYDGAISDYNRTLKINPNLPDVLFNRGFAKYSEGDLYGAIDDYTRSLGIHQSASAYCNRGIVNDDIGENMAAMKDYSKAILIAPRFAQAYFNRANLKYELKDLEGAKLDWQVAANLGLKPAQEMLKKYSK